MKNTLTQSAHRLLKENKAFLIFVLLMLVFRSAFADWNDVPTGSMKPTIVEGDRILVNKMAYDLRVPFTTISLVKLSDPKRGDIIIFDSEAAGKRLVKRTVGLPGDIVELKDNVLYINNAPLAYDNISTNPYTIDKNEDLLGTQHSIRINRFGSHADSFGPVRVPEDHYLALGDNRDNSADSRVIGFVPRNEIVGRSKSVVVSFDYQNYFMPRGDRFFHTL